MNDLKERTKIFAHRCVKLALALPKSELGYHIKNQLIRCSTSVAANYRASCVAQTKPAFIAKLTVIIHEIIFMQIQGIGFYRHIFIFQEIRNEVDV